jgi:CheY-like chemotaxis protein
MNKDKENHIRILIVDDDHIDKKIFAEVLADVNVPSTLSTAKDVDELFSMLSKPPLPHVIFLDVNLPGTSGIAGLRALKADKNYSHLPVVMYSVSESQTDVKTAYSLGAHYYMIKPYSVMNLRQSLKKLMAINWLLPQPIPDRKDFMINEAFILPSARGKAKTPAKRNAA